MKKTPGENIYQIWCWKWCIYVKYGLKFEFGKVWKMCRNAVETHLCSVLIISRLLVCVCVWYKALRSWFFTDPLRCFSLAVIYWIIQFLLEFIGSLNMNVLCKRVDCLFHDYPLIKWALLVYSNITELQTSLFSCQHKDDRFTIIVISQNSVERVMKSDWTCCPSQKKHTR